MRSRIIAILTICFIFSIFSLNALAQDEEKAPSFIVWEVVVKPDKVKEYEAAVKKEVEIFEKYKFPYTMSSFSSSNFHYYFSMVIENHAGIDAIYEALDKVAGEAGSEWQAMQKIGAATVEYMNSSVLTLSPTLSYVPENPRLKDKEENFRYWGYFYVKPGRAAEFEEIEKKWVELYKGKNISTGFNTYVGGIGADQPYYLIGLRGESTADYHTQREKNMKMLGDEMNTLATKTISTLRKYEEKTGMYRPDLSYVVEK